MFVTSEGPHAGIEVINPVTLQYHGVAPGPINMGGVDVDDIDNIIYSIQRGTSDYGGSGTSELYIYGYNDDGSGITQLAHITLPNHGYGMGLALDDSRDILWVGDIQYKMVKAYDVNVSGVWANIVEIPALSLPVSQPPVDITVDSKRNIVYTVAGWAGGKRLTKYDVAASVETYVDLGYYGGIGCAVDEVSGYVYITRGPSGGDDIQVWDCSTSPFTLLQETPDLGNPAGIAIANGVGFNPINLAKNYEIQGEGIWVGETFTYEITYDNMGNTVDVTGVKIRDDMPVELDYVSETVDGVPGTGVYDPVTHTVLWDIGTIEAGESGPLVKLVVFVNDNAAEGMTINNFANIWGDDVDTTTVDPQPAPGCDPEFEICDPGLVVPIPYTCYEDLPAPQLVFEGTEDYEVDGNLFTRYLLTVTNWADYPDELFELSPDLPACGLNTNSSRSWVDIFTADNSRIYGFCALEESTNLQNIWFAIPRGDCPPEQIYININDRRCDIDYTSNLVPIIGDITGTVFADCPAPGTGLLGVEIDLYNADGDLVANAITDVDGYYELLSVFVCDYTITIVTPLGYQVPNDELPVTVIGNEVVTVDFALTCVEITAEPRTIGFWKHQTGVATGGKGKAQIDGPTLCEYLDLIEGHFNGNAINQVIIYQPPGTDVCDDKLLVLKSLMNLKGSVEMIARARQQLMALLLNVASGKLSQTEVISADGATVSQAITYCDNVIDDPAGNYEMAKTIADEINNNRIVPAGMIPLSTVTIAYRFGLPADYSLSQNYPNPFNPVTTISFSLPVAGFAKLEVYNIMGQKVAVLVDGQLEAGVHSAIFDGRNTASGVYFYRLSTSEFTDTQKMVLLK